MNTPDKILDVAEAAGLLRCSPDQAEKRIRSGDIRGTRETGRWLTLESEVVNFVRRQIDEKPTANSVQQ